MAPDLFRIRWNISQSIPHAPWTHLMLKFVEFTESIIWKLKVTTTYDLENHIWWTLQKCSWIFMLCVMSSDMQSFRRMIETDYELQHSFEKLTNIDENKIKLMIQRACDCDLLLNYNWDHSQRGNTRQWQMVEALALVALETSFIRKVSSPKQKPNVG